MNKKITGRIHRKDIVWKVCLFWTLSPLPLIALLLKVFFHWNDYSEINQISASMMFCFCVLVSLSPLWDRLFGVLGVLDKWFVLDEDGVSYSTLKVNYHMSWQEIKHITLYPNKLGCFDKNCFICFVSTETLPGKFITFKQFNECFFGIQYRHGLIGAIQEYSNKLKLSEQLLIEIGELMP